MGFVGVRSPGLDVFASAHGATLLLPAGTDAAWRGLAGAQLGARTRMAFAKDTVVASEVALDYLEDRLRLGDVRHATGLVRLPVAQEVLPSLWVYAAPTLGIALPLYEGPPLPFFGVAEMPVGLSWTFAPEWTLLVEGGALGGAFWQPDDGYYAGTALLFHPPLAAALTRPP